MQDINAVAVSPDESLIVTASADKTARVWRMPNLIPALVLKVQPGTCKCPVLLRHFVCPSSLSPPRQCFVAIVDSRSYLAPCCLQGHKRGVWAASFSPVEKVTQAAIARLLTVPT